MPPQVLTFAGELLGNAESLIRDGLHPVEVADGYARAGAEALKYLEEMVLPGSDTVDLRNVDVVREWLSRGECLLGCSVRK